MDILYYTSPLYGGEVRAGLQKELNRLYFMFASRHPDWKGKVSIDLGTFFGMRDCL